MTASSYYLQLHSKCLWKWPVGAGQVFSISTSLQGEANGPFPTTTTLHPPSHTPTHPLLHEPVRRGGYKKKKKIFLFISCVCVCFFSPPVTLLLLLVSSLFTFSVFVVV
ncbi:hypothetical protein INR49_017999 [Caranx melampygus]|nr:hypothetical protein INR49_017999 [Caranx melampygus]